MASEVQNPLIRTRKRRVVSADNRKKALFSCDRCKTRKIACKRDLESARDPCYACEKASIECKTTIQRKKKIQGPIENIGLHYKCVLSLLQGLHPELDINNIDELIEFGNRSNIKMPSRSGGYTSEESQQLRNLALRLTSGKSIKSPPATEIDSSSSPASIVTNSLRVNHHPKINQVEQIYHDENTFHYLGPFGAPKFLENSVSCIASKMNIDIRKWSSYQNLFNEGMPLSSVQQPLSWKAINTKTFPYVQLIPRTEADYYIDIFFSKIHYRYLLFQEESFRKTYNTFWKIIEHQEDKRSLSVAQVCSIYMVMIVGKMLKLNQANDVFKYLDIVRICMSDMVLSPTLDGIRCLMLLAVYMDNSRKRESGYILIELATRQGVSMGIHRQVICDTVKDKVLLDEMKRVWWTLATHEIRFSFQLGRDSTVSLDEVTINYPQLKDIDDVVCRDFYYQLMGLNKYVLETLDLRRILTKTQDILSWANVSKSHRILQSMRQTYQNWDHNLQNLQDFKDYKHYLHLKFHYSCICLTFPYLLHVCNFPDVAIDYVETYQIVYQCLESSIKICELCSLASKSDILNGTLFPDIVTLYHATMALIIGFIYLLNERANKEIKISLEDIKSNIGVITNIMTDYSSHMSGSLRVLTRIMEVLIRGFKLSDENSQSFKLAKTSSNGLKTILNQQISPQPLDEEHENFFKNFSSLINSDFSLPTNDGMFELLFSNLPSIDISGDRDIQLKAERNELAFYDIFN